MKKLIAIILVLACCLLLAPVLPVRWFRKRPSNHRHSDPQNHPLTVQRKQPTPPPNRHSPLWHNRNKRCVGIVEMYRSVATIFTAWTAAALNAINVANWVETTFIAVSTTAMKVCVNTQHLRTVSTAPSTSAANPTAITADGPALNTAHITNKRKGRGRIPAFSRFRFVIDYGNGVSCFGWQFTIKAL